MSKLEQISQTCLYMGALLLVLFMDWCWYAKHYPLGNDLLKAEFFPVIYGVLVITTVVFFGLAFYFNWKSRPKHMGQREKKKKYPKGK